jgi:hypothetical protein
MIDIKEDNGTFKVLLNGEVAGTFRNENIAQDFAVSLAAEIKPAPVKKQPKKAKKAKKEKKNDTREGNMDD